MDRGEAISLLKELRANFHTLESTHCVLLQNPEKAGFWELHICWVPNNHEEQTVANIASAHRLDVFLKTDQIIFRRSK